MNSKIIFTDCDGVLLNWVDSFDKWMTARGHKKVANTSWCMAESYGLQEKIQAKKLIESFNQSAAMSCLEPMKDSRYYVRRLYEEFGYRFHVITSMGDCRFAMRAREINLKNHFGDAIERITVLGLEESKEHELGVAADLRPYAYWIEDNIKNAELGHQMGLDTFLMNHSYNIAETNHDPAITRVNNWKEIFKYIKKESI